MIMRVTSEGAVRISPPAEASQFTYATVGAWLWMLSR